MKKFFSIVPLQLQGQLSGYVYEAVGNTRLQLQRAIHFPIIASISGYAQAGEEIRVIAVVTDTEASRRNQEVLCTEVAEICREKGITCPRGVEFITAPVDDRVAAHVATFQKLIDLVEDDDELFACMTYGTKPMSMALLMAVQYAYRIKRNTSISCIVYGQIDRGGREREDWTGRVYDMTALVQLDEIVRLLADRKVANPKAAIDTILSL